VRNLCIASCGHKKIWDNNPNAGPTEARYAYIGPFAKKCIEYAEKFYPSSWCVLSAKCGFLLPDDEIARNYNVSFSYPLSNPISVTELSDQVVKKGYDEYDQIVVLGGRIYAEVVQGVFPRTRISTPLSNCRGIGYMMQKLKQAIERGVAL